MQSSNIDLGTFLVDGVRVGEVIPESFPDRQTLVATGELNRTGIEFGASDERLNSIFVTLEKYHGEFLRSGQPMSLSVETTPADVEQMFGEPYWRNSDDDEVILFYEWQGGAMEVQFEFPDSQHLRFITMSSDGVLADPEQRKDYGVDKDWPPAN